ncbi:hypothetical protein BGX29_006728 [Mortierella sp. GBA35]|nr:hypothetical protein BGX23_003390 [Mortierella sp. AD031]KAF9100296.1 hypothetical protein BGX29_006728 [Mortierella sp. GBA35]KAG0216118.1 hypothetical protein BGX33_000455 [Mortierella sp. NVP41]
MSVMNSPTTLISPQSGGGSGASTLPQHYQTASSQHDLVNKRSATWRYLHRVYQGGMVLYNTAVLSEGDLRKGYPYNDEKMQRRTMQYFMLGTSLATILEIPSHADCLKALQVVVQEYDYFIASESKSKMMFFRATSRKALLEGKSFEETGEYSQLEVRPLPFQLDYIITFASLCEMIAQVYEKLAGPETVWNLHNLELFQRVDSRFKKILATVSKELETMARDVMVDELNSMDPLGGTTEDWGF